MTATTAPDAVLMRFQPTDTATKVSSATLSRLDKLLGYTRKAEVCTMQYANWPMKCCLNMNLMMAP